MQNWRNYLKNSKLSRKPNSHFCTNWSRNCAKKHDELSRVKDEISKIQIEKAKVDTQNQVLFEEIERILGEADRAVIREKKTEGGTPDLESKIMKLRQQLDAIGGMDELTLKEYQETEKRYQTLGGQIADLKKVCLIYGA